MTQYLFIGYPKCETCVKARKWLEDNSIDFVCRNIVDTPPTAKELNKWQKQSGLPLKKFFNTSGLVYKELKLKDKISELNDKEKLNLLASNGMLIKRPILVGENIVLIGFKPSDWEKIKS